MLRATSRVSPSRWMAASSCVEGDKGMKGTEMTELTITIMSLLLFASVVSKAQTSEAQAPTSSSIKISRNDSLESKKASAEYFTGAVQVQELFPADDPSRTSGGKVTFEPGARSAWHTHPLSNSDRDGRNGLGSAVGRTHPGNSKRRCRSDPSGSETPARRNTNHADDAHCNTGTTQWQSRGVDGEGEQRAIPQVIIASP
jgi:hypothetical protein